MMHEQILNGIRRLSSKVYSFPKFLFFFKEIAYLKFGKLVMNGQIIFGMLYLHGIVWRSRYKDVIKVNRSR